MRQTNRERERETERRRRKRRRRRRGNREEEEGGEEEVKATDGAQYLVEMLVVPCRCKVNQIATAWTVPPRVMGTR